ncbi:MAG: CRISPR-associated protein Cas5 [Flavobacteriales bacterium]|nr:CRISPR-associated protein Cas5 [Flavobacteriales bacterium]
MEILSFDIEGKFAHFRKFHGNNTAMSYSIPPRTTIIGMLAATMGEEKDTYYKHYQAQHLKIGIRVLSNLKKSFHRLNLLMIKGSHDFRGGKGRVQTPFEVVTGSDLKKNVVKYRIYVAPGDDDKLYSSISEKLKSNERQFNISLGIAGFAAFITNVRTLRADEKISNNEWVQLDSAGNSDQIGEIDFPENPEFKFNHIEEELLPADFIGGEKGREVYRMNRVLFATRDFPMQVKLNGTYHRIEQDDEIENIQFLEYAGVFSQQTD